MADRICVVVKRPMLPAEAVYIPPTYEAFRSLLDGAYIEVLGLGGGRVAYFDEDGRRKGLSTNVVVQNHLIRGPIVFSRALLGEDVGLLDGEALALARALSFGAASMTAPAI